MIVLSTNHIDDLLKIPLKGPAVYAEYYQNFVIYCIYTNAKQTSVSSNLALTYLTWGCFKSVYKAPNWTMRAKPRPTIPNHHVRSALLWDVMRHRVVIYHQRFGTTYRPHLQSQDIQNIEEGTNEVNSLLYFFSFSSSSFLTLSII